MTQSATASAELWDEELASASATSTRQSARHSSDAHLELVPPPQKGASSNSEPKTIEDDGLLDARASDRASEREDDKRSAFAASPHESITCQDASVQKDREGSEDFEKSKELDTLDTTANKAEIHTLERPKEPFHRKGIWWKDYEEPEKSIRDFTAFEVGVQGEALAARYLIRRGLEVIEQNWRCKAGEVDIVAKEGDDEIALVEVKTRLNLDGDPASMPELAVDGQKQRTYRKLALIYLMQHPDVQRLRFDVIAITIQANHTAKLRHLIGTFTWDS